MSPNQRSFRKRIVQKQIFSIPIKGASTFRLGNNYHDKLIRNITHIQVSSINSFVLRISRLPASFIVFKQAYTTSHIVRVIRHSPIKPKSWSRPHQRDFKICIRYLMNFLQQKFSLRFARSPVDSLWVSAVTVLETTASNRDTHKRGYDVLTWSWQWADLCAQIGSMSWLDLSDTVTLEKLQVSLVILRQGRGWERSGL